MPPENPAPPAYPAPPWILRGHGLLVFRFPLVRDAEQELPEGWRPQRIGPGRTVSGFYLAEYETPLLPGDPTPWREWGNIHCMAKNRGKRGFFVSSMAVDNPTALRGGEEMWGLSKSLDPLRIRQDEFPPRAQLDSNEGMVDLEWREIGPALPFSGRYPFLTSLQEHPHTYSVSLKGRHRLCWVSVIRNEHPRMSALEPGRYFGVRFSRAEIAISAPERILPGT